MNLPLDHCVSQRTVEFLRQLGHDVLTLKGLGKAKARNAEVLRLATDSDRVLVTEDRGVGDIRAYPPRQHQGIVLLRVRDPAMRPVVHRTLEPFLNSTSRDALRGVLAQIEARGVRLRR